MGGLSRSIAEPYIAAAPAGARVRTRLHVSEQDATVLWEVGTHLGRLAGRDLAVRCREGRLDAKGKAESLRERKRGLTAESSSRWAGTITRDSEDKWRLAEQSLRRDRDSLRRRIRIIETRAEVPAGEKRGRVRGYATPNERHQKLIRLKGLESRLARVEQRLAGDRVSVVRGGKAMLCKRANLDATGSALEQWQTEWKASRLFLRADGDSSAPWGNYTITWDPGERWLDINLPTPLAYLANQPRGRYRLSCPVEFRYRADEVAAQAATGPVRYDIAPDPKTGRWYISASWKKASVRPVTLEELQAGPIVAVDVNDGHLEAAAVAADGNVIGTPFAIPLELAGLPASARDGRVRAAITTLIAAAKKHGAQAIVIEELGFEKARAEGRERTGNRPSRGKRGRAFRRLVAGIPTAKFRNRLVQMADNQDLTIIVIDPAYTSQWASVYWRPLLRKQHPGTTGHHAAALVIGRRGLGHRARTRVNGNRTPPEDEARPAPTRTRKPPKAKPSNRKPAAPRGPRQPPGSKTGRPHRSTAGNQVPEDRSRAPAE